MQSSPPRKGGAQREKEGKGWHICRYLSALWGGRAHGSSLAALLRWGRGKCTVILEELNQTWELREGNPARVAVRPLSLCPGSGTRIGPSPRGGLRRCPRYRRPLLGPAPPSCRVITTPGCRRRSGIWAAAQHPCGETFLPPLSTAPRLQYRGTSRR